MAGFIGRAYGRLRRGLWDRLSDDHRAGFMGIGWTTLGQVLTRTIRLGSSLILTRLLAPDVYGLLGIAMAVLVILDWLSDLGVTVALVRHPNGMEPNYLGTGWWISFYRGLLVAMIIVAVAPLMAAFNEEPELSAVLMVLSLRSVCHALVSPNVPTLHGKLNFRGLFLIEVIQTAVGTTVSILLAWLMRPEPPEPPTVWPVIYGILAGELSVVISSYFICGKPTRPRWDPQAARDIAGFSSQVLVSTLMMSLWLNFDQLVGKRVVSLAEMGLYFLAVNLATQAEGLLSRWCEVYFSVLARGREEGTRERWHDFMSQKLTRYGMPLMLIGVCIAPIAIHIMYDERYHASGLLLGILMIRMMVRILSMMQYQYLAAQGKIRYAIISYLVAFIVQAGLFFPLVHHLNTLGLPITALISAIACAAMQSYFLSRLGVAGLRPLVWTLGWMVAGASLLWLIT